MAALPGMKRMRSDTAGDDRQQLSKCNRRSPFMSPQGDTTPGDTISQSITTGQSKTPKLFTLLAKYHLIHDSIVSKLNHRDFYALCDTSPGFSDLLLSRRFDVNDKLSRFVENPKALREVMAKCAALLAGYFVLQLFEGKRGTEWLKNPLEFFVMTGQNGTLLKQHLLSEQYICTSEDARSTHVQRCQKIMKTSTYERTTPEFGKTVITVHTTEQHPLFSIIKSAHFTIDLHIMSWNKAYAPFSHEIFNQHKMYLLGHLTNVSGAVIKTYAKLGWSTTDIVVMSDDTFPRAFEDLMTGFIFPTNRLIGPSFSVNSALLIIFNDMHIPDAIPDRVLESCHFSFKQRSRPGGKCVEADISGFEHPLLRYSYTRVPRGGWDYVAERLERLLPFELAKLDPAVRPKDVLKEIGDGVLVMNHNRRGAWKWTESTKPEDWTFLDHFVPEWLGMAAQKRARQ